ncbi:MAG TPA: HEAT repeat domain-containing protein [Allosphingosinicella sp.]|jgi:hypothetical protein
MGVSDLGGLLEQVDRNTQSDREAGFLESRPLFEEILARNYHVEALNHLLTKHIVDESDEDIFTSGKFLVLASFGEIQLALIRYTADSPYIFTSPNEYMQVNVSGSSFVHDLYAAPSNWRNSSFDTAVALTRLQSTFVDDDTMVVKALDDVIDLHGFSRRPSIFIRLARAPRGDFEWAFDRRTLNARFYCTIRLAESNMCGILDLLAQHGDERVLGTVARLVDHPLHFVRWKAVQTVARLDREQGVQLARRSLEDRHPHVRLAAQSSLAAL